MSRLVGEGLKSCRFGVVAPKNPWDRSPQPRGLVVGGKGTVGHASPAAYNAIAYLTRDAPPGQGSLSVCGCEQNPVRVRLKATAFEASRVLQPGTWWAVDQGGVEAGSAPAAPGGCEEQLKCLRHRFATASVLAKRMAEFVLAPQPVRPDSDPPDARGVQQGVTVDDSRTNPGSPTEGVALQRQPVHVGSIILPSYETHELVIPGLACTGKNATAPCLAGAPHHLCLP